MTIKDLAPLAEQNLAKVNFQGTTPEQRMLTGFVYAKQHMQQLIPSGHTVDMGAAIAAQEGYEAQLEERKEIVAASMQSRTDLPEGAAISAVSDQSREYWISTYALASEGIGAYVTGYAKQQVTLGQLSEQDYYQGIDLRTKSFANIVHAGQAGQLAALVSPNAYYESAMQSSPAATTMRMSGQIAPEGGKLLIGSSATNLFALDPAKRIVPVQMGAVQVPVLAIVAAGALVIALVGITYVAYASHASIEKERIRASAEFMGRMCSEADKSGNESTLAACREYADKISTPTPQPFGLDNLSKYLVWGAVGLGALWMLPNLIERTGRSSR